MNAYLVLYIGSQISNTGVLPVAVEYSNIIPIRFTNAQLAQVDEAAAQFKIKRSTLIRQQLLSALSEPMEKTAS